MIESEERNKKSVNEEVVLFRKLSEQLNGKDTLHFLGMQPFVAVK